MKLQAFQGQNHAAHIDAHQAFMSSSLVKNNPPTMGILQAHISEHISFLAREEVMAKNEQEMQEQAAQFGGQIPPELQQQFNAQIEKQVAVKIAAKLDEAVAEEQEVLGFGQQGQDPLVEIKARELDLEQQRVNLDAADDLASRKLEEEKLSYKKQSDSTKLAQLQRIQNQRTAVQIARLNASKKR